MMTRKILNIDSQIKKEIPISIFWEIQARNSDDEDIVGDIVITILPPSPFQRFTYRGISTQNLKIDEIEKAIKNEIEKAQVEFVKFHIEQLRFLQEWFH